MKIVVKHNQTEIIVDDDANSFETSMKYSVDGLIKVLDKISKEVQAIENNYVRTNL